MLVNLVHSARGNTFLDPFAGVGGVVLEALESGYRVVSCDRDRALGYGLSEMSDIHCVADATRLPFASRTISGISTEPPYHPEADAAVIGSLSEMHRVLKVGARVSILCASRQAGDIRRGADGLGLTPRLDSPIDRKNLACVVMVLEKT